MGHGGENLGLGSVKANAEGGSKFFEVLKEGGEEGLCR